MTTPREAMQAAVEALIDLLALPVAKEELRYLRKGIGTATENAAWLRAESAISLLRSAMGEEQAQAIYEQRLRAVLDVVQRYLPTDGISKFAALQEIIGLVDPWPVAASPSAAAQADAKDAAFTDGDVFTLIGHAEYLRRVEGQTDMPAWFFGLAERIATCIGDEALRQRTAELAAMQSEGGS